MGAKVGYPKMFTANRFGLPASAGNAYPSMTTRYKGMHVKAVMLWVADIAVERCLSLYHETRAACCWALVALIHKLDGAGLLLSDAEIAECTRLGLLSLRSYQYLANKCLETETALYKVRPKCHAVHHMILQLADGENPRFYSTFMDEDLMGKVARVAVKCNPKTMSTTVIQRYSDMVWERWSRAPDT